MANPAATGVAGKPFTMDVERGKIREFAVATHSKNPAYLETEKAVIPPTFLTTTMFWEPLATSPWAAVELDQERGLHAEQEFVFHGPPPRAGTRLTCRSRIEDVYTRQGRRGGEMTFAVMVTEFRDHTGTLVAEARMTGVETAHAPTDGDSR